jgi:hypothetical protein
MNRQEIRKAEFQKIYDEAHAAGMAAGTGAKPTPMIVGTPTSLFSNDIDPNQPMYHVPDGVCGFAWLIIKPGTSAFAKWMNDAGHTRKDTYYGGVCLWVSRFNQSMARKEAYADAFANVLKKHGIKAISMSRMD